MKKNILWALIALFAATFESAAQNNSYNMVITMANGTTISIGPNEVKNISFNDGKVEMTGQTLDQLVERVEAVERRSPYDDTWIKFQFDDILEYLEYLKYNENNIKYNVNNINAEVDNINAKVDNIKYYEDSMIQRMDVLGDSIKHLWYQLDPIRQAIVDVELDLRDKIRADSTYLKGLINAIPAYDDSWMREQVERLQKRIEALEEAVSSREVKSATKKEDE